MSADTKKTRYRSSKRKIWVLNHLFNNLYRPAMLNEYMSDNNCIRFDNFGIVIDDANDQEIPILNSINGMVGCYKVQIGGSESKSTLYSNFLDICNSLEDDGLIKSKSRRSNQYRFFPIESSETFVKYLNILYSNNDDKVENHILKNSVYYHLMVNRQLVLNLLKSNEIKIRMD